MFGTSVARPSRTVVLLVVVALSCGLFLLHGYAHGLGQNVAANLPFGTGDGPTGSYPDQKSGSSTPSMISASPVSG
jgi:hypothetical protein